MSIPLRRLCVYCASNDGARPEYLEAARTFGRTLAERGIAVVYGGGRAGLMGALADAALAAGGDVTGVMPHALVEREVAHQGLTTLHVVDSMHTRKAMLADLADAFVALPGGVGTLEEFFEAWTWAQLGVHQKPVGLLDVAGFWKPLVALLDHVDAEGFLRGTPRDWLRVHEDANGMIDALAAFDPPDALTWLRPDVTDRARAEEAREAREREISALTTMGQIAARVAHEINNPLAGIQNAFLLVRGAIPAEHPHYHFVGAIDREIARIAAVTRQLYETYRPDQSMATDSSVILAINDAVAFLDQVNSARNVRIVVNVAKAPSLVPVPDALLRQTLYNLVQNAVDASPVNGTVEVTALAQDHECIIRVCDEGQGIPAEIRQRIFEPFFSTKDRTVKMGGMGIGLSLVRRSVLAVGGRIAVRDRQGGGTEFEVHLPMTPFDTGVLR